MIGKQVKLPKPDGNIKNYCGVFGALAGQNVKATSTLVVELIQMFVLKKMNICQEVSVPGCFINFRGKNNKNAIQNETGSFALGFGEKSQFDQTTLNIFREFTAKSENKLYNGQTPRAYFSLI